MQLGKRGLSLKTYQQCKKILQEELDVEPGEKIKEYYNQLI
jgi:DNA-binding SARP family transcriptional activator